MKNGNFKARCFDIFSPNEGFYTEGKIYEFKNGYSIDDQGDIFPYEDDPVMTIKELNDWSSSKWEFVDEKKTPIEYLLEFYDLKIGEKFKFNASVFHINDDMKMVAEDGYEFPIPKSMFDGLAKIEKLPWRPKRNEIVYFIDLHGNVCFIPFDEENIINCLAFLAIGWLFPNEEEAEANKERIMKERNEWKELMS